MTIFASTRHGSDIDKLAATAKTVQSEGIKSLYSELAELNVNVKEIRELNPTADQVKSMLEGIKKIKRVSRFLPARLSFSTLHE